MQGCIREREILALLKDSETADLPSQEALKKDEKNKKGAPAKQ